MTLRPATPADFAFLHALALRPENQPFINDETDTDLAAYLCNPTARLLVWQPGATPAGFALFCDVTAASGAVELRRLALDQTGRGAGLAFLHALTDYGFETLGAARVWLDASGENLRAQKVYLKAGYTLEGRLRAHWWRPSLNRAVDLMLYGILRAEWQTRR